MQVKKTAFLVERLAGQDRLIAELRARLTDVSEDRDKWRVQAERPLITAPVKADLNPSRWRWLFGRHQ
jgi:hypothetical protein